MDFLTRVGERIVYLALDTVKAPLRPDERLGWVYLLSAVVLAAGVFVERQRRVGADVSLSGFVSYAFPKKVYLHKSAKVDYIFLVLDRILFPLLVAPLVLSSSVVYLASRNFLDATFEGGALAGSPALAFTVMTLLSLLALDIGLFLTHYLQHRIPILWEFHKVHHSAQVLTPFTVYRVHPVDNVFDFTVAGALIGLAQGVVAHLALGSVSIETVATLNIGVFVFYLVGYNLRHSHIWLHYGPLVSRFVMSPAQHQIHHSRDIKHFDRNFGFMFTVWDRLAGTLYVPEVEEQLEYGLPGGEDAEFSSVWRLYLRPFSQAGKKARLWLRRSLAVQLVVLVALTGVLIVWVGSSRGWFGAGAAGGVTEDSVWMEDLTSQELEQRIADGWTTVLVPTAGIEQNGPHMILGKHHQIVAHTAEKIASKLGRTMVAPVVDYVPEGDIDPPSGHMQWVGTVSVSETVFVSMLEHIAASLRQHGFRTICFVGDSGDSQAAQAQVASRLSESWRESGVRVVQVGEYYNLGAQLKWLRDKGESEESIGKHAGIRDTSELLAVHPDGIRAAKIDLDGGGVNSGVDGDPRRASKQRGEKLLQLKIDAAVKAIQAARRR